MFDPNFSTASSIYLNLFYINSIPRSTQRVKERRSRSLILRDSFLTFAKDMFPKVFRKVTFGSVLDHSTQNFLSPCSESSLLK